MADRTSPLYSTIPLHHQMVLSPTPTQPHKPCQLFKLLLNTKPPVSTTERCIQRTLKKGSDIQMYKSRRCPPALASCPTPNPTAPSTSWSVRGAGAPSPMEGHRAPALHGPGLSCLQPPCPWPGRGKADKGRPQGEDSLPARRGLHQPPPRGAGGSNEPYFPHQRGGQVRAGTGRGCTHAQHLPLGKGDVIQLPSPQPWEN